MRTTSVLAFDTSVEAERIQVELWRRMSPFEKVRTVSELSLAVHQYPEASGEGCMLPLAVLKLGQQVACRVSPEAARIAGR